MDGKERILYCEQCIQDKDLGDQSANLIFGDFIKNFEESILALEKEAPSYSSKLENLQSQLEGIKNTILDLIA